MYEPSANFYSDVIQKQVRRVSWSGTITKNGTNYPFTAKNIISNSGKITNEISSSEMTLGTVFSSELNIGLYVDDIGIPRSEVYDAEIELNCTISSNGVSGTCPMGIFKVVEAKQNGSVCSIVAYDRMINFEKEFPIQSGINKPYDWIIQFCEDCDVTLGTPASSFDTFPNGNLELVLVWDDDIKTYRDALSELASAIGCSAHINRFGELELLPLTDKQSVATIKANDRYDSKIAQKSWRVSSVFVLNQESGKVSKVGSGSLAIDLDKNAFLQSEANERDLSWNIVAEHSVLDLITNIYSFTHRLEASPVEASIPLDPCLDLFDVVTLTGGQANNTRMILTSIEHKLGGGTTIKCAGANNIDEPLSSERGTSGTSALPIWMTSGISGLPITIKTESKTWEQASSLTWNEIKSITWDDTSGGGEEVTVVEAFFYPNKEMNNGTVSFTVNYELTEDARITYYIYLDNNPIWTLTEDQQAGDIVKTISTPVQFWSRDDLSYRFKAGISGVSV